MEWQQDKLLNQAVEEAKQELYAKAMKDAEHKAVNTGSNIAMGCLFAIVFAWIIMLISIFYSSL